MTWILPQPTSSLYDVGLFMVIVYAFTLVRLSIPYAFAVGALTLFVYPTAAFAAHHTETSVVVSNIFFLLGMTILGFFSNYSMGRYSRSNFLQRRLIIKSHRRARAQECGADHEEPAARRVEGGRTSGRRSAPSRSSPPCPRRCLDTFSTRSTASRRRSASGGFGTVYRGEHILSPPSGCDQGFSSAVDAKAWRVWSAFVWKEFRRAE